MPGATHVISIGINTDGSTVVFYPVEHPDETLRLMVEAMRAVLEAKLKKTQVVQATADQIPAAVPTQ